MKRERESAERMEHIIDSFCCCVRIWIERDKEIASPQRTSVMLHVDGFFYVPSYFIEKKSDLVGVDLKSCDGKRYFALEIYTQISG